ncbi:MAG: SecY-interacting protein Syd [Pseudomonadales bacterium]
MKYSIRNSLSTLFETALSSSGLDYFETAFDAGWRSECELQNVNDLTQWRPIAQSQPVDFSGLANAVEQEIHPDICEYYGSFWASTLESTSQEGQVSLIQLWNQEDFDRLIGNLIGHLMVKRRSKQPFTVFFANTEPDTEFFLSIDNETGRILLEEAGKPPIREVEKDLITFLKRLTPVATNSGIY